MLANDDCLTAIGKALTLRHGHVKMPGQHDGRNVSMIMRLLQLLVFALETGNASLISQSLMAHEAILAALRSCESSGDPRDLKTTTSGSWAGLSISALSHIVVQKMR